MSRSSRTPYVILGLLSVEPMSGYDLKATIDDSISQFWSESYGQLYPALKRMYADGLVDRADAATGGRRRHVYAITDAGREALRRWLAEPVAPRIVRNEMLLKLFFGRHLDLATLRGHLEREHAVARGTAQGIQGVIAHLRANEGESPDLPYWLLTLDLGRRTAEARAAWAESALATLADVDEA